MKGFNKPYSEVVAVKTLKGVLGIITCRIATGGWPHFRLTFSGFVEKALIKDLLKECTKMSTLDHPNVLTLMGVCLDGGPAPFLVMPFMFNGSLLSYLKRERDNLILPPEREADSSSVGFCIIRTHYSITTAIHR